MNTIIQNMIIKVVVKIYKKFLPPKLKYGSRRYLSGFLAVFEERGEPAGGRAAPIRQTYLCRRRRQKMFELFSE